MTGEDGHGAARFLRRALASVLSLLAVLSVVFALVVRTAHNELFTTDRYVRTVTELVGTEQLQDDVADSITDGIVDNAGLDSPQVARVLRRLRIDLQEFRDRMRGIVHESVVSFVGSEAFRGLWEQTNRTAHEQFVALLGSDAPATPLTVSLASLTKAAAESVSDSGGYITKVVPLERLSENTGDASFELLSADAVDTARTVSGLTSVLRWALLLAAAVMLLLVWLLLGRGYSSLRTTGIVVALAGVTTVALQKAGAGITVTAAGDADEETVRTVYRIASGPLVGYGVTVLVVGLIVVAVAVGLPARARRHAGQASGSL